MMDDVLSCCQRGGRLADHYMGFDAGIIMEELNRAGLGHLQQRWEMAVRSGICTMDPDLACWVRKAYEIRDAYGLEILGKFQCVSSSCSRAWFVTMAT